jgi:acyl carrier protein
LSTSRQSLYDFIQSEFLQNGSKPIAANDNLIEDGVIDSLAILILISFIEEQYSVSINPEDVVLENFESIEAINSLIDAKQGI